MFFLPTLIIYIYKIILSYLSTHIIDIYWGWETLIVAPPGSTFIHRAYDRSQQLRANREAVQLHSFLCILVMLLIF